MIRVAEPADAPAVGRIHIESWQVAYRGLVPDAEIAKMDLATRTVFWADRTGPGTAVPEVRYRIGLSKSAHSR